MPLQTVQGDVSYALRLAGHETDFGWNGDGNRRSHRIRTPHGQLPFRGQALGSGGFRLRTAHLILRGSACYMAACQARLETRSNTGVAHGVVEKPSAETHILSAAAGSELPSLSRYKPFGVMPVANGSLNRCTTVSDR
jgi:hypothetical protein